MISFHRLEQNDIIISILREKRYTPGALLAKRDRGTNKSQPIRGTHEIGSVSVR
jgi:hypothetical protein